MPHIASAPVNQSARISWPARLVGLGLLVLLPAAAHAPSAGGNSPTALAPVSVWARGFLQPRGVAVDSQGVVYVSDRAAGTVTRIARDQSTTVVMRIPALPGARAGAPMPLGAPGRFTKPTALAQDRLGALFVTTQEPAVDEQPIKRAIAKLHPEGRVNVFAGGLDRVQGLAFDSAGNLYVADGSVGRILRFLAPPVPELGPLAAITNEPSIRVTGTTLPESRLDGRVDGGSSLFTTQGEADGGFALAIPLTLNAENTLEIFTTSHRGDGLTGAPAEATVRHDNVPP